MRPTSRSLLAEDSNQRGKPRPLIGCPKLEALESAHLKPTMQRRVLLLVSPKLTLQIYPSPIFTTSPRYAYQNPGYERYMPSMGLCFGIYCRVWGSSSQHRQPKGKVPYLIATRLSQGKQTQQTGLRKPMNPKTIPKNSKSAQATNPSTTLETTNPLTTEITKLEYQYPSTRFTKRLRDFFMPFSRDVKQTSCSSR